MRTARFVSAVTLASFLAASVPHTASAAPADGDGLVAQATQPTPLRQSIARAADQAATQFPRVPARPAAPVRKQMTGGGGGGGMMMMTLLVTAASLAGTYFLMKELKKSTETAAAQ